MKYKMILFRAGLSPKIVDYATREDGEAKGWVLGPVRHIGICLVRPELSQDAMRLEHNRPIVTPQVPTAAGAR